MRLIDADALKSKIREQPWKQETKVSLILEWIYMLIDEASTVQNEALQQENEQLRAQVARVRETLRKAREALIDYKTFLESFQCTCEPSNETYPGVYCERCYRLDQAKQALEKVQEIAKAKADGRLVVLPIEPNDIYWHRNYDTGELELNIEMHDLKEHDQTYREINVCAYWE